ncbi:hypothetical protein [Natrinema sp. DC36]|uniref:hypothetical protein n=1 Tax=Natrinema sp. DC36 TaxID=2878680 RepID=UPI001CEFB3A8|nr:hypothetical protein [Natrinema sp. DC36]
MVDLNILSSNILGGVIALLVAVGVSRWEFNRQAKEKKKNWYRAVHNTCVRAYGSRDVDHRGLDEAKLKEHAQLYQAFSEQIENNLADAPTDEVDLPLFNALQNIQLSCIRYANEVDTPNPHKPFLDSRHDTIIDFCLIAMYLIEYEKEPDIEFLHELEGEELNEAEEKYERFREGTLYEEQNERAREIMQKLNSLSE